MQRGRVGCASLAIMIVFAPQAGRAVEPSPHCMARILADVPAEEAPEQVKSKTNGTFGPVTRIKVNRASGRMSYCSEHGYCYGSNAFEFETPCRLKLDRAASTAAYFSYFTR